MAKYGHSMPDIVVIVGGVTIPTVYMTELTIDAQVPRGAYGGYDVRIRAFIPFGIVDKPARMTAAPLLPATAGPDGDVVEGEVVSREGPEAEDDDPAELGLAGPWGMDR